MNSNPEQALYLRELVGVVFSEIDKIDCFRPAERNRNKLIFRLCVIHGLRFGHAAKRFGITAERVRQIVHRCERVLRFRCRKVVGKAGL